ncbi:MAG: ribulose-phosphate 3-epimerase [Desulfarculales bacterium]|jgi:ribulose-phosphate 3-epimerase|nr:ribulose-phosphate 3-epimerase [Desulfarculales bacterium]
MDGEIAFSASMMCADYGHLENEIRALEEAGIDSFHIDIMDGQFVRNFGMGIHDLQYIRSATKKKVEVHLMINHPARYVEMFAKAGVDMLYIHPESQYHASITIEEIISAGMTPALVISPGLMTEGILELLYVVKRVLVMGVNPGNAGQTYLPFIEEKIRNLIKLRDKYKFEVYWDGHGSPANIHKFAPLGVSGFVLGTAALFGKNRPYGEILAELKAGLK